MKKHKLITCIIGCILLISMLCSCGGSPKSLSGRYYEESDSCAFDYIEFFSDGKYTSSRSNYEGDYSIDGNRIRLEGILVDSRIYYFKVKGDTLELSYDEDMSNADVYKKQ